MVIAKVGTLVYSPRLFTMAAKLCRPLWQSISWEGGTPIASAGCWIKTQIIHHPNAYKGSQ